ncbi:CAP domain-containing protein [Solirubrobacter soli]|uniref:CAP domain-containing protein n=1 Tax=Solirubrobacter soli TaxID=363832 RepID=UPI0003FC0606|nr:CAP domain-containing protein [Solirubrobacter soli]
MPTTALRPLLAVAMTTAFTFAATPASASRGVYQCNGSLEIPQAPSELATASSAVICLVNIEREARGIDPLRRDADLARAARGHATDMAQNQFFAHTSPSGEGLNDRLEAAGYGEPGDGWRAGENLGWGTGDRSSPNALVDAWLNSEHHKRILLSPTYREIGVGVAGGAPTATSSGLPGATYAMDLATIRRG